MSSLDKIQKISKLGKILCSMVFVFCMIGIIGSVVGIAFLAAGVDAVHIGGVTLKSIVQINSGSSIDTANIYMVVAIILWSGEWKRQIRLTGKSKSIVEKRTMNKIELWKRGK